MVRHSSQPSSMCSAVAYMVGRCSSELKAEAIACATGSVYLLFRALMMPRHRHSANRLLSCADGVP
jgi:hypothetical protein